MVTKMKKIGGKWYSRNEFSTYEYRVKVRFYLLDGDEISLDLYTTQTDKGKIRKAINSTINREKCVSFSIEYFTTKAQDDETSEWLNEVLALETPPTLDSVYSKILKESRPERYNVMNGRKEIEISTLDIPDSIIDKINSFDLRSDLENDNIHGCILRCSGYANDETWVIDVLTEDGQPEISYLYTGKLEYNQDYDLLKEFA